MKNFLANIGKFLVELNSAKNAGITNDAGLDTFFRAEYKNDAQTAYQYWLATNGNMYTK